MGDYRTVEAGSTLARVMTLEARADMSPITSGTVNLYIKALSGANAGKWWKDSDNSWAASETANAMTHVADGHWTFAFSSASPWTNGVLFLEYAKESGDLHRPVKNALVAEYTALGTSARKVAAMSGAGDIAANAIDANALKSDAVTKIAAGMATIQQIVDALP